jgi:DNA-binding MarR family transcriptional regulator
VSAAWRWLLSSGEVKKMCALYCVVQSIVLLHDIMTRPFSSSLSFAQRRVLDAVVRRERLRQPNFVSDLVSDLGLRAESSLAPTLKRMERLGVVEIQGGGVKGRQRLVVSTEEGRLLCSGAHTSPLPRITIRTERMHQQGAVHTPSGCLMI